MKYSLYCYCFLFIFLLIGCNSSSSWAFQFVKYNNTHYIMTEEVLENNQLGEKLGEVKYDLNKEQDSKELSSNIYPVGTKIYAINNIDTSKAIAVVNEEGEIIKLVAEN
ncbi:hypothetical protein LAV73_01405 [Lysinibacillus xylanilyticus]|uniref:hypothetical protein n=1 Tax=Lysinibacillus xylanilyticus TaxID=582475 RepID=UPI002B23F01A|nr:hypothetical protein [Lysinibacillus xylanilyticus]MEB2278663.1 hypothetical protein [Lysinibacillus xylanilyticus]